MIFLKGVAGRTWPWVIAVAAIAYALWSFDWAAVLPVVAQMPGWRFIIVEAVLITGVFVVCAMRWMAITGLGASGSLFLQVYVYTSVAIAIGQNTPMQVGEALKIRFAQKSGLAVGRSAISLVMERLVDLAVIVDLALVGLLRRHAGNNPASYVMLAIPLAMVFGLPPVLRAARRYPALSSRIARLAASGEGLSTSRLAALVLLTVAKWAIVALSWQFALACVGCHIGVTDAMLTVATVSVISLLSMVPGGFGIQELSIKAMLVSLGIAPEIAEAGSIAIRLLTPVMMGLGMMQVPGLIWGQSPVALERG